ncbi:exopolyphosphatase [Fuerstiella marisgermanici]|uniref:Putative phosphohydrolase (DHH superfamily) n=1 Tax=Fuerstiella marisgermanici TaxID=1891926 RepID=A0A1P8WCA6_9PLAN|nr:exopolyphosphatase [Fuerstiella marisgermanici]APZ91691.1 putative phosphohydrolase (DHH superfamily) [Fuerstiella marisgermanici]
MSTDAFRYRLITRSDFDGLVCAALLRELQMLDDILFVHPKDMQDGLIEVTSRDIITNLPYAPNCHLCFDHHCSEAVRNGSVVRTNYILDPDADSAARVVYNYFGGAARFHNVSTEMMEAVDKADSARFTREEIMAPKDWALLNFIMDPRTGLGRFREFRISNYQLMMALVDFCRTHTIKEIMALPDVRERVDLYNSQRKDFLDQISRCSGVYGNAVVLDFRNEETIYSGNRFLVYALFPECNVSIHLLRSRVPETTVVAIGKSILNRTNPVDIGSLCLQHGGGGHAAAGTCQIAADEADELLPSIVRVVDASIEPIESAAEANV